MSDSTTWVGMDVHKENIVTVSISGDSGTVMTRWETPNTAKGKERLAGRIAALGKARCVYEAGPCGYDLRRFLDRKGIPCDVIAPSLIPTKPGDRIKTDRRDAEKLARMHRMGELTAICVSLRRLSWGPPLIYFLIYFILSICQANAQAELRAS